MTARRSFGLIRAVIIYTNITIPSEICADYSCETTTIMFFLLSAKAYYRATGLISNAAMATVNPQ